MATVSNTKFGIFKPHKQDFEEGQLSSDNPLNRSTSPPRQENLPGSKERNHQFNGNFNTKKDSIPKASTYTGQATRQQQRTFSDKLKGDFVCHENKFRSPQKNGSRKNDDRRGRSSSNSHFYPPHYGYGYPPSQFAGEREHPQIHLEKYGKNQKRGPEFPHPSHYYYEPKFDHFGYPMHHFSPSQPPAFPMPKNHENHPYQVAGRFQSELNNSSNSYGDLTQNKYYKEKQNEKNIGEQQKRKISIEDAKQAIEGYKRFFKGQQWNNLCQIIQQLVKKNNNGFQNLFNFMEKYQGRRKIRKSLKIFQILYLLNLQQAMDKMIESERAQRAQQNKYDRIKVLLRQLTRPLDLSG